MRMTKTILGVKVNNLNNSLGLKTGDVGSFDLNYAYGGVALEKIHESGGASRISSRVNMKTMAEIIDSIETSVYKFNLKISS